ncbi:MAG: acyl-CoA dehydrogenase [Gammaproteobacteria bacterium]|nr:acyl-CoA dehydrogenase [Gammaproteobacteria bacterium]
MNILLWIAAFAIVWILVYRGAKLLTFSAMLAVLAVGLSALGALSGTGLAIVAVIGGLPLLVLNLVPLRRHLVTRAIFNPFRKALPQMSETERDALEAGEVWWEGEMFRGRPDWSKLLSFKMTSLTPEEQGFLDEETNQLCEMLDDWHISFERRDLPPEVWTFIREKKFFAMLIGKEHGGLGFSPLAQSSVVAKIATRSITAAVTVMVPNSLGPGELLMHYGTPEQQRYWLPRLVRGEDIPCFGLTGPEVGSDASNLPDTGDVFRDQDGTLKLRLNFSKRYITLAPVATVIGLAFRLRDPDGLLGDRSKTEYGITCALVPRDTAGVEIGRRHYPGSAFMNGPIKGQDVVVPLEAIIGGPEMAGKGWRMLVECLSAGRGISLPALSAACGKGAYGATAAYAAIRRQFRLPIARFEGVQEATGRIAGYAYWMECCRVLTASAVAETTPSVVTAMMKYHMTEGMRQVLLDAMDVQSGKAVIRGPRNFLGPAYEALPVAITVEGANIVTRSLMIFGQGAIRCHPYVLAEMAAAGNEDVAQGLIDFDRALWGHAGYAINRGVRAVSQALFGTWMTRKPVSDEFAAYYGRLERFSSALAFTSDVAMGVLGGDLKRKERLSARLGDVLSHLYIASAVLRAVAEPGVTEVERVHARWSLEWALNRMESALFEFVQNFPVALVRALLKLMLFPRGRAHHGVSHALNAELANTMLKRNALMDRIQQDVFVSKDPNDPVARMLRTFDLLNEIEPYYTPFAKALEKRELDGESFEERLADAVRRGLLDAAQSQRVREYEALRADAVLTDDFAPEELSGDYETLARWQRPERPKLKAVG